MDPRHEELLRRLAINDEVAVSAVLEAHLSGVAEPALDARSSALVRLAALIALSSSTPSYDWCVDAALAAGATDEQVVGVLVAVAPIVGIARVNRASADIANALGHDLALPDWE